MCVLRGREGRGEDAFLLCPLPPYHPQAVFPYGRNFGCTTLAGAGKKFQDQMKIVENVQIFRKKLPKGGQFDTGLVLDDLCKKTSFLKRAF
jgi:hypothetical protein